MPDSDLNNSSAQVLVTLRKMILDGELSPGKKLAEIPVADYLGVSRMPVRLAFRTLEQEGLLRKGEKRGYLVREFTQEDVQCALEVRGVLEGLAARRLAERGVSEAVQAELQNCIELGNQILQKEYIVEDDINGWIQLNTRFHLTIIQASGSFAIADAIARNNHLPFASFDSIIIDANALDKEFKKLNFAHLQHQVVLDALLAGEGARAEMLMREHAYVGMRYAKVFGLNEKGGTIRRDTKQVVGV
jgi:GntR family transcriptional regulator of vanillate catabolism